MWVYMLLSLYGLSNALFPLDVTLHMTGDGCARYTDGGGLYIAGDRLQIRHSGTTGVCTGVDGELTVHNISRPEFFYLIRSIFALYNKWEADVIAAVKTGKSLWDIFTLSSGVLRGPAVILDENLVVAALNTAGFLSCRDQAALRTLRSLGRMTRLQRIQFLQGSHYSVHKSEPWVCPENYGLPVPVISICFISTVTTVFCLSLNPASRSTRATASCWNNLHSLFPSTITTTPSIVLPSKSPICFPCWPLWRDTPSLPIWRTLWRGNAAGARMTRCRSRC